MTSSILDQDLYKLSMMQAVMEKFPRAYAEYRFFNRSSERVITRPMVEVIRKRVHDMLGLRLHEIEHEWLTKNCPYLKPWFLSALRDVRVYPGHVQISDDCDITVAGPWDEVILWEVPLLAIISEVVMTWDTEGATPQHVLDEISIKTRRKVQALAARGCEFADFGTRRRFSSIVHDRVVSELSKRGICVGTSNIHLARKYALNPIGTMAHEWVQGVSGLVGLRHANRHAMELWAEVYRGDLGIALTDTFGTDAFWGDFDRHLARLYDGIRQDSGDPVDFMARAVREYAKRGINPKSKTIIFSDGLDVEAVLRIEDAVDGRIKTVYGIGTNLTCDVDGYTPMNIVVKLTKIDDVPVVKLSDSPGKVVGDEKAIDVARWTFSG